MEEITDKMEEGSRENNSNKEKSLLKVQLSISEDYHTTQLTIQLDNTSVKLVRSLESELSLKDKLTKYHYCYSAKRIRIR